MSDLHLLTYVGLLLLVAQAAGALAARLGLPRITGYIVSGMAFGPAVLGVFPEIVIKDRLSILVDFALSLIAFMIGGTLESEKLRRLGRVIAWITPLQALGAVVIVTLLFTAALGWLGGDAVSWRESFAMAFIVGAICAATAPAAVLAIVHECRARGPLTTTLLGVVAVDDALTILLYAFAVAIAGMLYGASSSPFGTVLAEIAWAGVLGLAAGIALKIAARYVPRREAMLGLVLGLVLLSGGVALSLGASPLLANMIFGFVAVNSVRHYEDVFGTVESVEEPVFALLFALAGAHLEFSALGVSALLVVLLVAGRFTGKLIGARAGAALAGAPPEIARHVGYGLLPKAGVTVGLALHAQEALPLPGLWNTVISAILASTLVNELIAPPLVRKALTGAGEAGQGLEHERHDIAQHAHR